MNPQRLLRTYSRLYCIIENQLHCDNIKSFQYRIIVDQNKEFWNCIITNPRSCINDSCSSISGWPDGSKGELQIQCPSVWTWHASIREKKLTSSPKTQIYSFLYPNGPDDCIIYHITLIPTLCINFLHTCNSMKLHHMRHNIAMRHCFKAIEICFVSILY